MLFVGFAATRTQDWNRVQETNAIGGNASSFQNWAAEI